MAAATTLALAIAVMLIVSLGAGWAWASSQPGTPRIEDLGGKTYTVSLKSQAANPDSGLRQYQSLKNPNKVIKGVKSSNKSVATATAKSFAVGKGKRVYILQVNIKKTGTTKLTYTFGNKKHTVKYVVKQYENPLETLEADNTNYAPMANPDQLSGGADTAFVKSLTAPFTGKVTITPQKGWKVKKCWYYTNQGKIKYFKSGATLPKWITLFVWLKKGSQNEVVYYNAYGTLQDDQM